MGLSIVKRLVLLLGHELEVKSSPGRGTVFRLLLQPTELADMSSMVLGADTIPATPDEDRTILFIDDEEAVRAGMKDLLEEWGFTVLLADSAVTACQAVRSHPGVIDMVVSDLRLGGDEDGISAIAQVRQQYGAPLPGLLITGDTSPAEVKRAHDSGHPVLFKPVRTRDLFAALRKIPK
jgi:CheY-like chemotaxis protein